MQCFSKASSAKMAASLLPIPLYPSALGLSRSLVLRNLTCGIPNACLACLTWHRGLLHIVPPSVDRIWSWVHYNKIPIYPDSIYFRGTIIHRKRRATLRILNFRPCYACQAFQRSDSRFRVQGCQSLKD